MDSNPELGLGLKGQCKPLRLREGDENEGVEQVDSISDLPDDAIGYILSFLETEEVVRTSILSSRCRYIWKGITRLSLWCGESVVDRFANLVDHVLLNCNSTKLEESERFVPESIDFTRLSGWICSAQSRGIEKLIFRVNISFLDLPDLPLPQCILTCTTLVALELRSFFDIEIPNSISCFLCLKSLHFCFISPDHDDDMHRLLSCCLVLEDLHLIAILIARKC